MDPITIGLAAIAVYGLFARSGRCPTPEEFLALNGSLDGYEAALQKCKASASDLESLRVRASALQSQAKVMVQLPDGSVVDSSVIDTGDLELFESSWCDPDEIEGPDGQCIPAGATGNVNGIISRSMTGRYR